VDATHGLQLQNLNIFFSNIPIDWWKNIEKWKIHVNEIFNKLLKTDFFKVGLKKLLVICFFKIVAIEMLKVGEGHLLLYTPKPSLRQNPAMYIGQICIIQTCLSEVTQILSKQTSISKLTWSSSYNLFYKLEEVPVLCFFRCFWILEPVHIAQMPLILLMIAIANVYYAH
jgi:hypothetical protein